MPFESSNVPVAGAHFSRLNEPLKTGYVTGLLSELVQDPRVAPLVVAACFGERLRPATSHAHRTCIYIYIYIYIHTYIYIYIYVGGDFLDEKALEFPNLDKTISSFDGEETIAVSKAQGLSHQRSSDRCNKTYV